MIKSNLVIILVKCYVLVLISHHNYVLDPLVPCMFFSEVRAGFGLFPSDRRLVSLNKLTSNSWALGTLRSLLFIVRSWFGSCCGLAALASGLGANFVHDANKLDVNQVLVATILQVSSLFGRPDFAIA